MRQQQQRKLAHLRVRKWWRSLTLNCTCLQTKCLGSQTRAVNWLTFFLICILMRCYCRRCVSRVHPASAEQSQLAGGEAGSTVQEVRWPSRGTPGAAVLLQAAAAQNDCGQSVWRLWQTDPIITLPPYVIVTECCLYACISYIIIICDCSWENQADWMLTFEKIRF